MSGGVAGPDVGGEEVGDGGRRARGAVAGGVVVPAAAGLLALAAGADEDVAEGFGDGLAAGAGGLALEEGDVEAAEVLGLEGAHGEAVGAHGGVDVGDGDAGADEVLGGGAVAFQDAVADEAVADAGLDRDLARGGRRGRSRWRGSRGRFPGWGRSRAASSRWPG